MSIQSTYNLTLKDGMYYKVDGTPFPKSNACNAVKGKLSADGFKVTVVPVKPDGYALRILDMSGTKSTVNRPTEEVQETEVSQQPAEGTKKTVQELQVELAELEKRELELKIARKRLAISGDAGTESDVSKGSAPSRRPKRTPFTFNKLKFPDHPGYVRRVVSDVDGGMRVAAFESAGWKVVTDPLATVNSDKNVNTVSQIGSGINRHVGVDERGQSIKGVLMEIPEEWYNEDQAAKKAQIDETEKGLRRVDKDGVVGGLTTTGYEAEVNKRI